MNDPAWFAQTPFRVRLEWGRRGARAAAGRGDILVVVDSLCFSTNVAIAVSRGGTIIPCAKGEDTPERAALLRAEIAVHRNAVPVRGRFSLSPVSLRAATPGTRILMASPNGATCSRYGDAVPALFTGSFLNARVVADAVTAYLSQSAEQAVTVLACGERWDEPDADDGNLRFAVEDYLGAGAVIAYLPESLSRSPEATAAVAAFNGIKSSLLDTLRNCGSGIELMQRGYESDVIEAAALNTIDVAPRLQHGMFAPLS